MKTLYEANNLDVVFEIFRKIRKTKIHPIPPIYDLSMEAYAKACHIEMVKGLVNEMKEYLFYVGLIHCSVI